MKRLALLCLLLFCATALTAGDPVIERAEQETRDQRRPVLISHGVNPKAPDLIAFLKKGFSDAAIQRGLPTEPIVKSEVANKAVEELGLTQSEAGVPILMQIAAGDLPPGVLATIRLDVEMMPVHDADILAARYSRGLRKNAVVALGLIGDPQAADTILEAMREYTDPLMISEGAVSLGLLGDSRGLLPLVVATRNPEDPALAMVFAHVYYLTGRNYDITSVSPIARRREAVEQLRQWYEAEGTKFVPVRAEILRRRDRGLERTDLPLETLRGALRATRDSQNYDRRYAGRERLRNLGPGMAPQLREISMDPLEDLDIRRAAMTYYAGADPERARKDMKYLAKKDENSIIRGQAESLMEDIERALEDE
ncbi:hypothetical protein KQI84_09085 [bacterium]|nr:hypothetical protein [bacterium]